MEGFINRTRTGVNFAIRPRGAKDLNILGEHGRESILVHANKGCREGTAVRKDRTLEGGEVDAMIVINGEDTDEADLVAAAAAAGVDAAAAAAAADAATVAVLAACFSA
jgi:3-oxoacyl-ACP reductase-like protein